LGLFLRENEEKIDIFLVVLFFLLIFAPDYKTITTIKKVKSNNNK